MLGGLRLRSLWNNLLLVSFLSCLSSFCIIIVFCVLVDLYLCFLASPSRGAPLEPRVEEQSVEDLVTSQVTHQVDDSAAGGLAGAQLPSGLSVLDALEAAARADAVVGEGSVNNPSPAVVDAEAVRPSSSKPSTFLLTRAGDELAQLGRVERVSELLSFWEAIDGCSLLSAHPYSS